MSFICMRMKNHFHIKGWALNLVLMQRPGGTRKWPILTSFLRSTRVQTMENCCRFVNEIQLAKIAIKQRKPFLNRDEWLDFPFIFLRITEFHPFYIAEVGVFRTNCSEICRFYISLFCVWGLNGAFECWCSPSVPRRWLPCQVTPVDV